MSHRLSEKATACLILASIDCTERQWGIMSSAADRKWTKKAVDRKFEELARKGYVAAAVTPRTARITEKGRAMLNQENRA